MTGSAGEVGVSLKITTYLNAATEPPEAVSVRSSAESLYVPLVCVDVTFAKVRDDRFVYEICVTFARTPLPSAVTSVPAVGSVLHNATFSVSLSRSIALAKLTTKSFTFVKLAILFTHFSLVVAPR